jgi:hypothetical protein
MTPFASVVEKKMSSGSKNRS